MEKNFLRIVFFITIILSINLASAEDILYVTSSASDNIISSIENLNFSYKIISCSEAINSNLSEYKAVLLESKCNVGKDYKTLIINGNSGQFNSTVGIKGGRTIYAYTKRNSPITQNIDDSFQVYKTSSTQNIYYLSTANSSIGKEVVANPLENKKLVVASKQNPRSIFFGLTASKYWTNESKQLFENSLFWVVKGEDKDKDGYYSDEDCNDSDPNIHPGAKEILDKIDQNCLDDPPFLYKKIENQTFLENESSKKINLDSYFKDYDGDKLSYSMYYSDDNSVAISVLNNSATIALPSGWYGQTFIILKAKESSGQSVLSNKIIISRGEIQNSSETESESFCEDKEISIETDNAVVEKGKSANITIYLDSQDSSNLTTTISLYDITDEEIVYSKNNFSIQPQEDFQIAMQIPSSINDTHEYGILVEVDKFCNLTYKKIRINKNNPIEFLSLDIDNELVCREKYNLTVDVKNTGDIEKNIALLINSPLINKSKNILLYPEMEDVEIFGLTVPEVSGDYSIKAKVMYDGRQLSKEQNVTIQCENITDEDLQNNSSSQEVDTKKPSQNNIYVMTIILIFLIIETFIILSIVKKYADGKSKKVV